MNDLRTAAQQALEAMDKATRFMSDSDYKKLNQAIEELRAALAEPVEPVAKVELMMTGGNAGLATRIVEIDDHLRERLRPGQLLYTAPPPRKPLTQEEIPALAEQVLKLSVYYDVWALLGTDGLVALVRAVEAKHGIKESP